MATEAIKNGHVSVHEATEIEKGRDVICYKADARDDDLMSDSEKSTT